MPATDASLKPATAILKPESPCAMLLALGAIIVGAESCIETTFQLTNRVCDRYFPTTERVNSSEWKYLA